jgi:glucose-1-phosphate thymidylyltransferase
LATNIIEGFIVAAVEEFEKQERGTRILLKEVPDAGRFGVADLVGTALQVLKKNRAIQNRAMQ